MTWNVTQLQERLARREQTLESEIPPLHRKASQNDGYRRIHDRQVGAHQVFILLSRSDALSSREAFLAKLRAMREDGPDQDMGAFDTRNVRPGWDDALEALLNEFSKQ